MVCRRSMLHRQRRSTCASPSSQNSSAAKNVVNGRRAVHFARATPDGSNGQFLEMYNNIQNTRTTERGFTNNPFENSGVASDKSFTILLVARTSQSTSDTLSMGIVRLAESSTSPGEGGMYLSKSCSNCVTNGGIAPSVSKANKEAQHSKCRLRAHTSR